ncbi:MAG: HTH domain-containing protein [Bacteroidota bacterium]
MHFLDQLQQLKRLDLLIRRKATGTATELANRMGISRATVYRNLQTLKSLGASIQFCTYRKTYYYDKHFVLKFDK